MYNRNDPRFRRTLNQITQNLESANESAQVGLFSISQNYIKPCFASITTCVEPCTEALFPRKDDRLRRRPRAWSRGRAELNFDFYDDWEDDENDALLSLENDELERLLGEPSPQERTVQPGRRRVMSYGSRNEPRSPTADRRASVRHFESGPDPTVIPNQSYFGFLNKLPFKIGRRGLRYKPSAEGLQERAKADKVNGQGVVADDSEGEANGTARPHRRTRSGTQSSGHTTDSFSSRGDIFPSDDEDAVPLDDELTGVLERRTTNSGHDDRSSGKTKTSKHESPSTQSLSSRSSRRKRRRKSSSSTPKSEDSDLQMGEMPVMQDVKIEERRIQAEEDGHVEKQREAAQKLAVERGPAPESDSQRAIERKSEELTSPISPMSETITAPGEQPETIADDPESYDNGDTGHELRVRSAGSDPSHPHAPGLTSPQGDHAQQSEHG